MTSNQKSIDDAAFRNALARVLDYLWNEEQRDYLACPATQRTSHIFIELQAVAEWLGMPEEKVEARDD